MAEATRPEAIRTEYPFTLPRGYVDREGSLHREIVFQAHPSQCVAKGDYDWNYGRCETT